MLMAVDVAQKARFLASRLYPRISRKKHKCIVMLRPEKLRDVTE